MNQVSDRRSEASDQFAVAASAKNCLSNTQSSNQNNNASQSNDKKNDCRVQVAVRVRPFINKELVDCESSCVKTQSNKIIIGGDKDFEFDKVIDQEASQEEVYQSCVKDLLNKSFEGYNATVLAYGQTGSGKTFTMGTSNTSLNDAQEMGIIPRVIREIFSIRREKEKSVEMLLKISYFEIYNDNIIDLLDPNAISGTNNAIASKKGKSNANTNNIFIREELDGSINLYGITEEKVNSPEEMLAALERGGLCRSTSATLMNQTSSRSHAVFTIFLEQHSIDDLYQSQDQNDMIPEDADGQKAVENIINEGFKTSKFHFVDLAGSERIKKTGAVGNTMKEGININMGLLSLGNVISALTEPQKPGAAKKHIPYRDSKLTRILQDSLGGNSNTLMIACVSPAESNFEESLNTLKYASRARRIKNKPIVNRDPQSALISSLKQQIQEAHLEIAKYRQLLVTNNVKIPEGMMGFGLNALQNVEDGGQKRKLTQDLMMLKQNNSAGGAILSIGIANEADIEEIKQLRLNQVKLEKKVKEFQAENSQLKSYTQKGEIEVFTIQKQRDEFRLKLEKIIQIAKEKGLLHQASSSSMDVEGEDQKQQIFINQHGEIELNQEQQNLFDEYNENIQKLKKDLLKKDQEKGEMQFEFEESMRASIRDQQILCEKEKKIITLNRSLKTKENEIKKLMKELQILKKENADILKNANVKLAATEIENIQDISIMQEEQEEEFNDDGEGLDQMSMDPEYVQMESQLKLEENQNKLKLSKVDGSIQEKSEDLRRLNQNQLELQKQLLEKMKEQYHQKIIHLETDMKKIEYQRDDALQKLSNNNSKEAIAEKQRVIESFKQKVADMQSNLNEYKRKAKEQETLQKTVQAQERQIQQLGVEINKFKQLKTNLYKELKKNNEEFEKFKQKKYKDLMNEKKKNIENEKQIFKLQNQTKKQERLLQKKQEEYNKMIRSRDLIKKIISSKSTNYLRGKIASQRFKRKQKTELQVGLPEDQNITVNTSINSFANQSLAESSSDDLEEILDKCLCKLIESIEIEMNIEKVEEELKTTSQEQEEAQQKYIEYKLNLEKKERAFNEKQVSNKNKEESLFGDDMIEQQQQQIDQQKMELEEIQSRLESLEAKYEFTKEKLNKLINDKRLSSFETLQNELLTSQKYNNIQTQKILFKYLIEKFGSSSNEILRNQDKIENLKLQIADLQQYAKMLQNQKDICQIQLQQQIDSLQNQLQATQNLVQSQSQPCPSDSDSEINQTQDEQSFGYMQANYIGDDGNRRFNKNKGSPPKQISSNRYKMMRQQAEQSPFKKDNKNQEDIAKLQQKQINDLTRQLKQHELRVKTLQNRNDTLQQKYDDLKKANCKDKFIGINKQSIEEEQQSGQLLQNQTAAIVANHISQSVTQTQQPSLNLPGLQQNQNISKNTKEIASIQSLKDRRKEIKGKANANEGTPQNNQCTNTSVQNTPQSQYINSLQNLSAQSNQQEQHQFSENRDDKNIQFQILDKVTNNETHISLFASKTKAHSLAQKRNIIQEARLQQNSLSQQQQQQQQQALQQLQILNTNSQGFGVRGRPSLGKSSRQETQMPYFNNVTLEIETQQIKNIDTLNTSSDNTSSYHNSVGYNLGSPLKVLELPNTNSISLAESEDLTAFHSLQQAQHNNNNINRIVNEMNNHGQTTNNIFNNSGQIFSFANDLSNSLNQTCQINSQNNFNNSQLLQGQNESGLRNSVESNNGLASPGDETPFSCKYECLAKINDAHTGQVFCVESHENFLFSTSVKSLKIWDLETLKCVSDIQAHNHFVKGLAILEQEKWIATACDKYINIWDMISMQKVCTLTGHNVDIKQLYVDQNHILYSAGKGLNNFGALVTWDIRKQQVIDEREKNQDIFSILPYNNIIYYASRDHYVRRINMETNLSIDPFKPPHYDAVTSLAILNGYLVSGSKDHNLKLWNINPSNISFKQQTHYSNEQVICLESNKDNNLLYVGQKDGKIKVVTTQNNKFRDISDINNGLQSVNCITKIQSTSTDNVFACGSADKIIKIWKPTSESQYNLAQLKSMCDNELLNANNQLASFQTFQSESANDIIESE
ncbi:hypothetical protein ABPG72_013975 [Tetrahymena utriculariae]